MGHDLLTNGPMSVCKTAVLYYKNGDASVTHGQIIGLRAVGTECIPQNI